MFEKNSVKIKLSFRTVSALFSEGIGIVIVNTLIAAEVILNPQSKVF